MGPAPHGSKSLSRKLCRCSSHSSQGNISRNANESALPQQPSPLPLQEQQQSAPQQRQQQQQQQSALQQLGVVPTPVYGAMAGAAAEVATFPLEVVRRQMQLGGRTGRGGPGDVARVMREVILKGGGPQALYTGILPATLQVS